MEQGLSIRNGSFASNINFNAWSKTLPLLPIMLIVCLLDCLLKLASTESKLPVKADKDYEIKVYGIGNLFTTLSGSSVGYMQLKFNVINYGVLGNVTDRRGGVIYALMCGVTFFWSTDLFNYLPKFFLSTLLFFAGSGFVAENLWGSRKYLSLGEWLQIFFILGVFIASGSILYAVIVGGLLTGMSFITRYAKVPCIQGHPLRGGEVVPTERSDLLLGCSIRHISNHTLMVVKLKGFIFFASAQKMTAWVTEQIDSQKSVPEYKRIQWIIFDCHLLDGLDASASKSMAKLSKHSKASDVELIWTGMSPLFKKQLEACDTITSPRDWFNTTDEAVQYTDNIITNRLMDIQHLWQKVHPMFELSHKLSYDRDQFDPFAHVLPFDMHRFGCPWQFCGRLKIKAYETVLWKPGMPSRDLLLLQSGSVGIFRRLPGDDAHWQPPAAVYTHGWFLNRQALLQRPTRDYGVALQDGEAIFWNELQWSKMVRERPEMAASIMKAVLLQDVEDSALYEREKKHSQDLQEHEVFKGNYEEEQEITFDGGEDDLNGDEEQQAGVFEIRHHVQGLMIAQNLDRLGFYAPVGRGDEAPMPNLPEYIAQDINIAFTTFALDGRDPNLSPDEYEALRLPSDKVSDAMKYAGLYNTALAEIPEAKLTRADFTQICLPALLMPLSKDMTTKLRSIFEQHHAEYHYASSSVDIDCLVKTVDRTQLTTLLKN